MSPPNATRRTAPWRFARPPATGPALAELLERHQSWVYAIALRMVREPADAADLSQEALLRVVTRISQFAAAPASAPGPIASSVNCFLDAKRSRSEQFFSSFARYGQELDRLGLAELDLDPAQEADRALIVEEAKIGCMLGMLALPDPGTAHHLHPRGDLRGALGHRGEVLGLSPEAFRKRLERSRADLTSFMNAKCGLVNPANPCRCPKKTAALIREGWVDPRNSDSSTAASSRPTRKPPACPSASKISWPPLPIISSAAIRAEMGRTSPRSWCVSSGQGSGCRAEEVATSVR